MSFSVIAELRLSRKACTGQETRTQSLTLLWKLGHWGAAVFRLYRLSSRNRLSGVVSDPSD